MNIKITYREGSKEVEILVPVSIGGSLSVSSPTPTFNATEIAEADHLGKSQDVSLANQVFGTKSVAPSTVVAEASMTAPVDMTGITSAQTPAVFTPPVVNVGSAQAFVAPALTNPASAVDLDVTGLPWDARIHASTRSKIADGSWKLKRGVNNDMLLKVQGELRQVMAIPTPPVSVAQAAQVATEVAVQTFAPPPPPVATAPVVFAPPPPPAPSGDMLFKDLILLVTNSGITQETIVAACNAAGLPNLPTLAQRPDLVSTVARNLGLIQ